MAYVAVVWSGCNKNIPGLLMCKASIESIKNELEEKLEIKFDDVFVERDGDFENEDDCYFSPCQYNNLDVECVDYHIRDKNYKLFNDIYDKYGLGYGHRCNDSDIGISIFGPFESVDDIDFSKLTTTCHGI